MTMKDMFGRWNKYKRLWYSVQSGVLILTQIQKVIEAANQFPILPLVALGNWKNTENHDLPTLQLMRILTQKNRKSNTGDQSTWTRNCDVLSVDFAMNEDDEGEQLIENESQQQVSEFFIFIFTRSHNWCVQDTLNSVSADSF